MMYGWHAIKEPELLNNNEIKRRYKFTAIPRWLRRHHYSDHLQNHQTNLVPSNNSVYTS